MPDLSLRSALDTLLQQDYLLAQENPLVLPQEALARHSVPIGNRINKR